MDALQDAFAGSVIGGLVVGVLASARRQNLDPFVLDLSDNDDARVMVETMVLLAHKLHLTVCAEGVETQAALDFLDDCGCDRAQGYFIGRPMPGEAIPECVRTWNAAQGDEG